MLLRRAPSTAGTVSVRGDSLAQVGQGAGRSNSAMRLTDAKGRTAGNDSCSWACAIIKARQPVCTRVHMTIRRCCSKEVALLRYRQTPDHMR